MRHAHVLEHADGDDAVVLPLVDSIIAEVKSNLVGEPSLLGAQPRHAELLARERETGNRDAALSR